MKDLSTKAVNLRKKQGVNVSEYMGLGEELEFKGCQLEKKVKHIVYLCKLWAKNKFKIK